MPQTNMTVTEMRKINEEPPEPMTPMTLIQAAVQKGGDITQLEKLMDLQERYERNQAAASFASALAEFQGKCPPIHKGRSGAHGAKFAGFDDIMATIKPFLAACGLSVSFDTEHTDDNRINCTCIIKHGIHEHRTKFTCPVATDLKANSSQKYGSALSYVKRYSLSAALNLVTTDEDVDAQDQGADFITQDQVAELHALLTQTGSNIPAFFAWMGVDEIGTITQGKQFNAAIAAVRKKVKP